MKEVVKSVMVVLWLFITLSPLFGWEMVGDKLPSAIAYAGLTIGLSILLK